MKSKLALLPSPLNRFIAMDMTETQWHGDWDGTDFSFREVAGAKPPGKLITCNFKLIDELLLKAHSLKHTVSTDGVIKLQTSQQRGMELLSLEAAGSQCLQNPLHGFPEGCLPERGQKSPWSDSQDHLDKRLQHLWGSSSTSGHDGSTFQNSIVGTIWTLLPSRVERGFIGGLR